MRRLFVRIGMALAALALVLPGVGETAEKKPKLIFPAGMSAEIGGGIRTFMNNEAIDTSPLGAMWTARFIYGTRSYFGVEGAYEGSYQAVANGLGVDNSAVLLSNAGEGLLRGNLFTGAWQPYLVVGFGYRRYSLQNEGVNTSSIKGSDDVPEIPVGIGLAYRTGGLVIDLRGMYRTALDQELIPEVNLNTLNVGLKVGFEF